MYFQVKNTFKNNSRNNINTTLKMSTVELTLREILLKWWLVFVVINAKPTISVVCLALGWLINEKLEECMVACFTLSSIFLCTRSYNFLVSYWTAFLVDN
jgi:hypothetical protein